MNKKSQEYRSTCKCCADCRRQLSFIFLSGTVGLACAERCSEIILGGVLMMHKFGPAPCLETPRMLWCRPGCSQKQTNKPETLIPDKASWSCSTEAVRLGFVMWGNCDVNRGCWLYFFSEGERVDIAKQKPDYSEMSRLRDSICCRCCSSRNKTSSECETVHKCLSF